MPPDRFETLIGEPLIQMGFYERTVEVTKRSGDGGIDVMGVYRSVDLLRAERLRQSISKQAFVGRLVAQDAEDERAKVVFPDRCALPLSRSV